MSLGVVPGPLGRAGRMAGPLGRLGVCPWPFTNRSAGRPGVGLGLGRSMVVLCPLVRVFHDECAAERTRRSALPSSCHWARADGVLGGTPSEDGGWAGPWLFSARRCGGFRINAQRADTEVRAPASLRAEGAILCWASLRELLQIDVRMRVMSVWWNCGQPVACGVSTMAGPGLSPLPPISPVRNCGVKPESLRLCPLVTR